jgi:hypothetical protein
MKHAYGKYLVILLFMSISLVHVFAADQLKTTDTVITSQNTAITSVIHVPFTVYIGDNLIGVDDPMKSAYITVSGTYTGGGTLVISLNSVASSSQTFSMPNVSKPTHFEFLYADPSHSVMQPTSAGNYNYTLDVTPSGVSISNFSAKLSETHRYSSLICPDGEPSNQKVKTTESLVVSHPSPLSSPLNSPFSFYIGDDMSGISDPIQSYQFIVSGIYIGGGSLALSINSLSSSTKTFSLPTVTSGTYFEFTYKDSKNILNPQSAGTYNHILNTVPSGITISNYAVKLIVTYKYKPPSCGSFPIKGNLYSPIYDTTGAYEGPSYNSIMWKGVLGGPSQNQGKVRFQLAASHCANGAIDYPSCTVGAWAFVGGSTCTATDWFDPGAADTPADIQSYSCLSQFNNKRYFRYQIEICSDDCLQAGNFTPRVDDVIVNWAP